MTRAAVFEVKTAFLWTDFGLDFAKRHFSQEQIDSLPKYKRGTKAGKIKGAISWVRVKEGGYVYFSPLKFVVPHHYIENRPGKTIAYSLATAEWSDEQKIIASTYIETDFQIRQKGGK